VNYYQARRRYLVKKARTQFRCYLSAAPGLRVKIAKTRHQTPLLLLISVADIQNPYGEIWQPSTANAQHCHQAL
jgi:hypothetical protein